jgi:hypothetical protein
VGYAVVIGFGAAFSIFTTILVILNKKFGTLGGALRPGDVTVLASALAAAVVTY